MVASGQQSLSRRRAKRRGMKTVVFQAAGRQAFCRRRVTWTAKGAGGAKARVIKQDDQDIRSTFGWAQLRNRRELGVRIFRIVGDQACARSIRDWKNCSFNYYLASSYGFPLLNRFFGIPDRQSSPIAASYNYLRACVSLLISSPLMSTVAQ